MSSSSALTTPYADTSPSSPDPFTEALLRTLPGGDPWEQMARPAQRAPAGDWLVWLMLAGRGFGKTRSGAEWAKQQAQAMPGSRGALIAAKFADGRDTMVEGESGLLTILPPSALRGGIREKAWNRSLGELHLDNGSRLKVFSSERPGSLRGPQHHYAWGDEPAEWLDASQGAAKDTTWSNLLFGLRLGQRPRVMLTGTPKPLQLIKDLLFVGGDRRQGRRPDVHLTTGSTYDNLVNLAPTFREQILAQYEGTRIGRQELQAELLEDVEGALWQLGRIEELRVARAPELVRVVVAIDPAVTSGEDSDETGIVVAGRGLDGHGYVLADRSGRFTPKGWAERAVLALDDHKGDRVVAEANNGGDMVEATLRTVRPTVPFLKVTATRGKRIRAEPIAALYEQGRVHHVGSFDQLEDQMCSWLPDSGESPDRMDALVWALSELMEHSSARAYLTALAPPCLTCGMPNKRDATACAKCGAKLTEET